MVLNEFALLASDTPRTKAYLQMMVRCGKIPGLCIVYTDVPEKMKKESEDYQSPSDAEFFDLNEPVLYTLKSNSIDYVIVENKDVNSDEMMGVIRSASQSYMIYSGYGGYILKPDLFRLGKKFVHVHAGLLPFYRGSTTAYYSMLQENYIGATSIFLSEGIDEGGIITSEKYPVPEKGVNIDILYEPYLRSQVLKKTIEKFVDEGKLESTKQDDANAQTYFIIHPVLKHIALMSNNEG